MKRRRTRDNEEASIDLTPIVDMIFIMLIFFVVTASFIKEAGIDVNKPGAVTAERKERASILIAIDETGRVWMDRRPVDVRAVRANIMKQLADNPQGSVVIQADTESKNGVLVQVMDAARQAGVLDVALAARPLEE